MAHGSLTLGRLSRRSRPNGKPRYDSHIRAKRGYGGAFLHELERLGIRDEGFHFNHEFGVVLLMGPHHATGYHQVIESIHASDDHVRVVAFEEEPADGGEPRPAFRTYTIWIVPNSVYRPGTRVEVVSPDGVPIASTEFSR